MRQMHANLMRSARFQNEPHQRDGRRTLAVGIGLEHLIVGDGFASEPGANNSDFLAVGCAARQRRIDSPR